MGRQSRPSKKSIPPSPYSKRRDSPQRGPSHVLRDSRFINVTSRANEGKLEFNFLNGTCYTIPLDQQSSPEYYWGTIYFAEWHHLPSGNKAPCVIKATEFLPKGRTRGIKESGTEYRRPKIDFENEIMAFQKMDHQNVLRMYDFWEWEGRGYIAMKKMIGSLGDLVYESVYRSILD